MKKNHLFSIPDSARVSVVEAKRMIANYAPRAGYVERNGQQLPNTRCAWIPVEYLEALLAQTRDEGGDGVRIYLSAYDSEYTEADAHMPPRAWWGYNTLLFVSTRDSVSKGVTYHRDITTVDPINRVGICPPPPPDGESCEEAGATLLEE